MSLTSLFLSIILRAIISPGPTPRSIMAALKLAFMALAPALAAAADVPLWGQCGGIGWQSAGSACTSVATCTSFNDYYCWSTSLTPQLLLKPLT